MEQRVPNLENNPNSLHLSGFYGSKVSYITLRWF